VSSQTSNEEYLYLTKGLKIQMESGLDLKKGYELKKIDYAAIQNKKVELYRLIRLQTNEIAAHLIIFNGGSGQEYICVPTKDASEELRNSFFDQLSNNMGQNLRLSLICFILSRNLSIN
jgi:hypothetical protein